MTDRDYADLRALRCIIEQGSFVAAARELRLSRSALSEAIRRFEARLGIQLLNRTTRSVSPTSAGERLAERFGGAAAEIEAALREAIEAGGEAAGTVRVHAQRLGYETVLRNFLPRFVDRHPRISVEVEIGDAGIDIVSERFDAGIRLGELLDQDVIAIPLQPPIRQVAVAAPAYLERHGEPRHPRELRGHRCVCFRWPGHNMLYNWEFYENDAWFSVPVSGPLTFNDQRATIEAAMAGAGIAFWVESEVQPHIDAGHLVPILLSYTASFPGFALYYPRHRHRSPAVNAFIAALRDEARR
ncbi:LysR family transcriptional regulator [Pseudoroseomonas ludipueritiae]|uniref:LysR family transcriptional regulator n=1 Tax=Pseudoroseomonas ludipueritiae TaxID=198093 RepID=A0ABR7R3A8_9PROT|nr:LysR family transcriptional regulator [Pseudoroseomonas ludipueritiae]MBC9176240.1 LysR family transcriptional regulator [Pseudoroseomonas ludipueritiae]